MPSTTGSRSNTGSILGGPPRATADLRLRRVRWPRRAWSAGVAARRGALRAAAEHTPDDEHHHERGDDRDDALREGAPGHLHEVDGFGFRRVDLARALDVLALLLDERR